MLHLYRFELLWRDCCCLQWVASADLSPVNAESRLLGLDAYVRQWLNAASIFIALMVPRFTHPPLSAPRTCCTSRSICLRTWGTGQVVKFLRKCLLPLARQQDFQRALISVSLLLRIVFLFSYRGSRVGGDLSCQRPPTFNLPNPPATTEGTKQTSTIQVWYKEVTKREEADAELYTLTRLWCAPHPHTPPADPSTSAGNRTLCLCCASCQRCMGAATCLC